MEEGAGPWNRSRIASLEGYMGRPRTIANLKSEAPRRSRTGLAEQRVGRRAVRARLVAVRFHAVDFRFEQCDAVAEFFLGIGCEIFACEAARGVAFESGRSVVIH